MMVRMVTSIRNSLLPMGTAGIILMMFTMVYACLATAIIGKRFVRDVFLYLLCECGVPSSLLEGMCVSV
jgi:hypothetical protein